MATTAQYQYYLNGNTAVIRPDDQARNPAVEQELSKVGASWDDEMIGWYKEGSLSEVESFRQACLNLYEVRFP